MYSSIIVLLLATLSLANGGYLTAHHPLPSALSTRTILSGGATGGGPSTGAFSSSQFSQTVSSPAHVQSTISTYNPINHGYYGGQRNQGQSGQGQGGYLGSNQGNYGYGSNVPSVIAYGYSSGQGQSGSEGNQGYGGRGSTGSSYNNYDGYGNSGGYSRV